MAPQQPPLSRPERLRPGDVVGLVSPASPVEEARRIEEGTRYLEGRGFRVKIGRNVGRIRGYLAGTDQERADDLHDFFRDPDVRAIFCLRGGYGVTRLLPLLDYALIRTHPKIVVGYSDITALLLALAARAGLVSFHGPMAAVDFVGTVDPVTEDAFWEMLTGDVGDRWLPLAAPGALRILQTGRTRGRLLGGNLSLLAAMAGTPYLPDFTGSILFLEEIGEEPYRVDRMLTQLSQSGIAGEVSAILAGQFTDCEPRDPAKPSLSVEDVLHAFGQPLGVPFASQCRFGHIRTQLTLPVGLAVEVDLQRGAMRCEQSPVRVS
jgi:muramoyltetrapeptide carboxypeptidase